MGWNGRIPLSPHAGRRPSPLAGGEASPKGGGEGARRTGSSGRRPDIGYRLASAMAGSLKPSPRKRGEGDAGERRASPAVSMKKAAVASHSGLDRSGA